MGVGKRAVSVNGDGMVDGSDITTTVSTDAANDPAEARLTTIFEPVGTTLGIYVPPHHERALRHGRVPPHPSL